MLTYTYQIKGQNFQTSFFTYHIENEVKKSRHHGITIRISKHSSDSLNVVLSHSDSGKIQKFADWLKNASKGSSKVTSIRKL